MEGLEKHLPGQVKAFIADHNIKFYTIDGIKIGKEIGLGGRINTVLQSAFFKLASIIPEEEAIDLMKKAAKATYGRKGDKIVQMNYDAIDAGAKQVVEVQVPDSWKSCEDEDCSHQKLRVEEKMLSDSLRISRLRLMLRKEIRFQYQHSRIM